MTKAKAFWGPAAAVAIATGAAETLGNDAA
jgi:hypothetical protein